MKLTINQLCRATGFSHEQLLERNRQGNRPLARYLVARELHKRGVTRAEIGRLLGIDQSTATHGILTVIPNVIKTKTPLNGYYMIAEYRKNLEQIAQGEDFCPFVYESNVSTNSTCRNCNEPLKHPETLGGWCSEECKPKQTIK